MNYTILKLECELYIISVFIKGWHKQNHNFSSSKAAFEIGSPTIVMKRGRNA